MKLGTLVLILAVVGAGTFLLFGNRLEWNIYKPPHGFAIVREHVISAPRNVPPIRSLLDFTVTEIDGAPVKREIPPPFVDMQRGALVQGGIHSFRARVQPHLLPRGYQPYEVSFVASVEVGKVYYLVDTDGGKPVLVEEHIETR